ncbi:MAG: hypothetical protein V1871_08110 [Planctomycetota bacterium]
MIKLSFYRVLLSIVFFIVLCNITNAYIELKKRWEIDFEYQPLKIFTYVDSSNKLINYYYFIYTLTNKSDKTIPLYIDVCLKMDLHHPDLIAAGYSPKVKYYQDSLHPLVEDEIIFAEEKLLGLSLGVRKDKVNDFKSKFFYLNCQELRTKQTILSNEKIIGLAIFENVDRQAKTFEIMIGGLLDSVKRRYSDEIQSEEVKNSHIERDIKDALKDKRIPISKEPTFEYENRIRKITYICEGGEFNKQSQALTEIITAPQWVVRNYGPIDEKNTLKKMIDSLEDENPEIRWSGWFLLRRLTGLSFNYDTETEASSEENQKSIKLWQEWWYINKEKLTYNKNLNQFEISEQTK